MGFAKHILVPTDFSELSLRAVDAAAQLAACAGAHMTLVHVIDPVFIVGDTYGYGREPGDFAPRPSLDVTLHERLAEVVATRIPPAVPAHTQLAVGGKVATAILEKAEELDVDLICIASHGRTGLSRIMLGSVAEQVLRQSERSVLTVKIPEEERLRDEATEDEEGEGGEEP